MFAFGQKRTKLMPLHIYRVDADGKRSAPVMLDFADLQAMGPALTKFRSVTGVRMSEYDDTKVGGQHMALLMSLLREQGGLLDSVARLDQISAGATGNDHYFVLEGE